MSIFKAYFSSRKVSLTVEMVQIPGFIGSNKLSCCANNNLKRSLSGPFNVINDENNLIEGLNSRRISDNWKDISN